MNCLAKDYIDYSSRSLLGRLDSNDNSTKNFTDLPPHWSVSFRADVLLIASMTWDQDFLRIFLDSNMLE